jgi:putative endonuclease
MSKRQSYNFGIWAERVAEIILILKGYKILQRRYKSHFGEIDLIAKRSNNLVFIEVKARKRRFNIEEVLSTKQVNRIKNSAQFFIVKNPQFSNFNFRFDFIEVNKILLPKHYPNFLS